MYIYVIYKKITGICQYIDNNILTRKKVLYKKYRKIQNINLYQQQPRPCVDEEFGIPPKTL